MKFFLPYATENEDKFTLFKVLPSGELTELWEWPHSNITATVRRNDDRVVALIDYTARQIYSVDKSGARVVCPYEGAEHRGVAVLRGRDLIAWYSLGQGVLWYVCENCQTRGIERQGDYQIITKEVVVDAGHVVVDGLGRQQEQVIDHSICIHPSGVIAIPVSLGQVCSPTSPVFQYSKYVEHDSQHCCLVYTLRSTFQVIWKSKWRVYRPYTFASVGDKGRVVQIALHHERRERFLWLLYREKEEFPYFAFASLYPANKVLVDLDAIYISAQVETNGYWCFVFKYDGTVAHVGRVGEQTRKVLEDSALLCANIRNGKRPLPISENEDSPLWACALVTDDREYVQRCVENSWIPSEIGWK